MLSKMQHKNDHGFGIVGTWGLHESGLSGELGRRPQLDGRCSDRDTPLVCADCYNPALPWGGSKKAKFVSQDLEARSQSASVFQSLGKGLPPGCRQLTFGSVLT